MIDKSFSDMAARLTPDEAREQLRLAYEHMKRCNEILQGHDVPPVDLMDDNRQTALELYYRCKKEMLMRQMDQTAKAFTENWCDAFPMAYAAPKSEEGFYILILDEE